MKVGLVIYGSLDTLSGGYLYDRKLVESLRAQGDIVEIISLPWRNYAAHLTDNFWFQLPGGFDILIQDELNHPSLIAANAGRHPFPVISLVHHLRCSELRSKWQNDFYRIVEKKYLQGVDGFIFNSETTQREVYGVAGNGRPGIVANPPTDRFGMMVSGEEITKRVKSNELRILFLGNVIKRKGLHTLIDALAMGRNTNFPYKLDVVGSLATDPNYARTMQETVRMHDQAATIHFHGPLDNEQLMAKLKQAHVLVVPSSYEGFGIVYLEGMGFGLPAIGTTAGAAGEIIRDGETGYLVAPNDSATLASRLTGLSADRGLLTRLSLNALQRYRLQPTWEQTAGNIRSFLKKLIT